MGRIRNTITLAKRSGEVLRQDKELLVLPVMSFVLSLMVLAIFVVPAMLTMDLDAAANEESVPAVSMFLMLLGVLGAAIVNVFFTGALVAGAHERMTGGDPTVRSAIGRAFARLAGLVPWAILTTTVGMILRSLRERAGWLGKLIFGGLEMAWEVAAFLTIPAIVIDEKGPIEGFKASAGLLRQTWGENLAARVGFGLLGMVLIIPAVLFVVLGAQFGATIVTAAAIAIAAVWVAAVLVVMAALGAVFQTALYLYATTGSAPQGFDTAEMAGTFSRQ